MNTIDNQPQLDVTIKDYISLDDWLEKTETFLKANGYRRYNQNLKLEDFAYWKTFYINGVKAYQVGLFFYDFRKYQARYDIPQRIGIQFECMLICEDRIDLSVSKECTLLEFEEMSLAFYNAMAQYLPKN